MPQPLRPSLAAHSLSIRIPGIRTLIDGFSMALNPGDKVGVIGAEGTGKSTLLHVLAGRRPSGLSIEGVVTGADAGLLAQSLDPAWSDTPVVEFLLKTSAEQNIAPEQWNDLQPAVQAIIDVGLDPALVNGDTELTMRELSGGERVRVRLAKLILARPDVYLLDEPTNDLDIRTLEWLEEWIAGTDNPIAFISHDETLLERCANRILHLQRLIHADRTDVSLGAMDYRTFVEHRRRTLDKQALEAANQRRERERAETVLREHKTAVQRQQEKIKDSSARRLLNKKMKNITSREGKLAKQALLETPEDVEAIKIDFPNVAITPKGKRLLELSIPSLRIEEVELTRNVELHVQGPEKVVIIGDNGAGKSTLIRAVVDHLHDAGRTDFGYFPQNYEETLIDPERRAIDYVIGPERGINETMAGILMARLNIPREEMESPVRKLSGGQKAKVVLIRLMTRSGFLILDEPTRNLSPLSNEVLRNALRAYPGAILAVSHDRAFIGDVADRVLELAREGLHLASGG